MQAQESAEPTADSPPPVATVPVSEPGTEAEAPAEDATRLDTIEVTATKRLVSVREIPATVHALAGEDLERIGAQRVDNFVKLVAPRALLLRISGTI